MEPEEEYQVDVFFIPQKDFPNEVYTGGVIAIDIFTKFIYDLLIIFKR